MKPTQSNNEANGRRYRTANGKIKLVYFDGEVLVSKEFASYAVYRTWRDKTQHVKLALVLPLKKDKSCP